jgi:DNA polymerase-3 subunit epsilon
VIEIKDMAKKRPIDYDTETTGVRSDKDRIIELAAFDPERNLSFVQFINPQMPIPPESTAITNITDAMVADAPTFEVVGKQFFDFCGEDVILIAHNNDRFDKLFLECEAARSGLVLPSWNYVDSLKWARKYRPNLPSHSLQNLREVFGITANQAHRALDDVMVLYQIFSTMTDDLHIETVFSLLSESKDMNRMPFGKYQGKPFSEVPKSYLRWLRENGAFDKAENKELKESLEKLGLLV